MKAVPAAQLRAASRQRGEPAEGQLAWLLVLPSLAVILGLNLYPVAYSLWISLRKVSLLDEGGGWVGLANYRELMSGPYFWDSVWHTVYFTVVSLAVQVVIGIAIALVLNHQFFGRGVVRALVLLPWAIPTIVNGILWQWILQSNYGALNGLLTAFGLIHKSVQWLGRPLLAMNMVIVADTWKMTPFYVLMFLAALQTVPDVLYEAAAIDGGGFWAQFRNVTFPFLKPVLLVVLVLRTMQTFRVFEIIYMLTGGGPGGATNVVGYYAYLEAFRNLNFSAGAAVSFLIVLAVMAVAGVYMWMLRSESLS